MSSNYKKLPEFHKNLTKDLETLIKDFLGDYLSLIKDDPFAGIKTQEELDQAKNRIRATILVAHSELQSFLESIALESLGYAYELYEQHGVACKMLMFFLTSKYEKGFPDACEFKNNGTALENDQFKNNNVSIEQRYDNICRSYKTLIKKNYGIKQRNLMILFHPLGISLESFDKMKFFSLAHSFGEIRGDFAHEALNRSKYLGHEVGIKKPVNFKEPADLLLNVANCISTELFPEIEKLLNIPMK